MAQITISGISGGTPPYTIKVYKVGDPTPVYTGTTSSTSFTATFSQPINADYYATIENGVCTAYQSGNTTLNCNSCITTSNLTIGCSISNPIYRLRVTFDISGGSGSYDVRYNNANTGFISWITISGSTFIDDDYSSYTTTPDDVLPLTDVDEVVDVIYEIRDTNNHSCVGQLSVNQINNLPNDSVYTLNGSQYTVAAFVNDSTIGAANLVNTTPRATNSNCAPAGLIAGTYNIYDRNSVLIGLATVNSQGTITSIV